MRRFFLPGTLREEVTLTGADARHLGFTLRAKTGDRVLVVDSAREAAEMEAAAFTANSVTLRLVRRLAADTESPVALMLAMCLPKGDKMDFIVQKATELGAAAVQPLAAARCVARYDERKAAARRERWQRIANEAAKQCGRTARLAVAPVRPLAAWLKALSSKGAASVFMAYEAERRPLKDWIRRQEWTEYTALIGPEGGFSPEEARAARAAGVATVSLGPRILRAETAALAALVLAQYERGDLGGDVAAPPERSEAP